MEIKQKGFAPMIVAMVVVGIMIAGGGIYWWQKPVITNETESVQIDFDTQPQSTDQTEAPTETEQNTQTSSEDVVQPGQSTKANIVLRANTTDPLPGTPLVFTADITGQDISTVILTDSGQYDESDDTAPYAWTLNLSKQASGQRIWKVVAIVDGKAIESNSVTITVKPDLSELRQLTFEPGEQTVLFQGSSEQLRLMGLFNDGFKRDLTQAAMETVYSEKIVDGVKTTAGDSPVISVSADGEVMALQPGTADVVATNNGVTTTRRIKVVEFDE